MTNTELCEEAKKRYPVGTKYKDAQTQQEYTVEIPTDSIYTWFDSRGEHSGVNAGFCKGYFYYKNKWAEVISSPQLLKSETTMTKEELLIEAKRRYPDGTAGEYDKAQQAVIQQWEHYDHIPNTVDYTSKQNKKGFDEKEHLSKPYNQLLEVKVKKVNKKQIKLQLL